MGSKHYSQYDIVIIDNLQKVVIFSKSNSEETQVKLKQKEELYKALKEEGDGKVCPLLSRSILFGVAYHNSGKTLSTF